MNDVRSQTAEKPKTASPANMTRPGSRFRSLADPESLREFVKNLHEGIYITSRDGRLLDCNAAFLAAVGASSLEELGEYGAASLYVDPAQRTEELRLLEQQGFVREFEIVLRGRDGKPRTVLDTCYMITDPDTGEEFFHGILFDITARKELEASLREASTHDPLTGALNRWHLIAVEERFAKDPLLPCGCIFVDVDNFKMYNDRYGHLEGDEVLKRMSRFLMRYVRAEEAVLRVGGDEFVVLLDGADDEQTKRVADRLRAEALERAPVPFSLGYAAREPGETIQHLLDRADKGLLEVRVVKRKTDPRMQALQGD
jgi:diguanylate cyclase (GGDEF)-like protein/PAS domain S-box-containing protein